MEEMRDEEVEEGVFNGWVGRTRGMKKEKEIGRDDVTISEGIMSRGNGL